jgi:hypothetical protein
VAGPFDPRGGAGAIPARATTSSPMGAEVASALRALDERLATRTDDDLEVFAARWPTLADQTLSLVVDGGEPAERRWSLASAASAMAPGQLEGEDPVARLIAGPAVWGSLLGGESNIVTELSSGRLRCVNKRDTHRLRSEELHAMTWLLGLTQIPVERTPAAVGSERE